MENERLTLIKVDNPFDRVSRMVAPIDYHGESLLQLRQIYFPMESVAVSVNGIVVKDSDLEFYFPRDKDQIVMVPRIEGGGGGKDILRTVMFIAVVVASMWAGPILAGAFGFATTGFAAAMFTLGLNIAGHFLVNALLPPVAPDVSTSGGAENSQVYSWSPQTTQMQGGVIPRCYGRNKLYGNVISSYLESDDTDTSKQYLNALIALGQGPFSSIPKETIKINDQPIANFTNVDFDVRLGTVTQTPINNFNDTKTEYALSVKVTDTTPYTYTTIGNNYDELEVEVTFPQGLFYANDSGSLSEYGIQYKVEISPTGLASWTSISTRVATTTTDSTGPRWTAGYWLGDYWNEVAIGSSTYSDHNEGDYHSVVSYKYCRWRWETNTTFTKVDTRYSDAYAAGASNKAVRKIHIASIDPTAHGKYDIKVTAITPDKTDVRYGDDMYLTTVREVQYDDFTYPQVALLGIRALASDQLSGSIRASCIADCQLVRVYNGASWSTAYSNNPAWVCYDILSQPVLNDDGSVNYYEGTNPSRIDTASFYAWAEWCDELVPDGKGGTEKRFTFNGVFDTESSVWEQAWKVCQMGRAALIWKGINLHIVIDKEETPVQLFSVGNTIDKSFEGTYLSMEERASEIEIDFINAEKDYERDTLSVFNTTINRPSNKTSIQLLGCTSASQAWRQASYRLLCNEYLLRTLSINVDVDSIACTVGQVVRIQSDIPAWGKGGRVVSSTNNTITLDQEVTISSGTYEIEVRKSDSSVESKTIASGPGTYTTLTINGTWTGNPAQYDVYSFGKVNISNKDFRIIQIERESTQKAKMHLLEYRSEIYGLDTTGDPEIPTIIWTDIDTLVALENLTAESRIPSDRFDNTIPSIIVNFDISGTMTIYKEAEVWYKKSSAYTWTLAGTTRSSTFTISSGIDYSETYDIKVVGVNNIGKKAPWNDLTKCPETSLEMPSIPDFYNEYLTRRITGLQIYGKGVSNEFDGHDCKLVWNDITTIDVNDAANEEINGAASNGNNSWFRYYEVKIIDADDLSTRRIEYSFDPSYTYTYEKNLEDGNGTADRSFYVEVRAVDIAYRRTQTPGRIYCTNPAPDMSVYAPAFEPQPTALKVSWFRVPDNDLSHYKIYCDSNNPPTTELAQVGADTTTYTVFNLSPATTYYVQIQPYDLFGVGTKTMVGSSTPTKMPWESVETETVERLTITDSLDTTSTELAQLIDYTLASGGIAYTNGDWVQYKFPVEQIQNAIWFVCDSTNLQCYVSLKGHDDVDWTFLKAEADHTLDSDDRLLLATNESDAQTNYWSADAGSGVKNFALYPNGLSANYCRIHIRSSVTLRELRFVDQVIAEQISTTDLAAINANLGTVVAGVIQSSDWDSTSGVEIDLNNETVKFGGSDNPKLSWDSTSEELEIRAGDADDVVKISGGDSTYRIWVGDATAADAPFSVKKDGTVYMSKGKSAGDFVIDGIMKNSSLIKTCWVQISSTCTPITGWSYDEVTCTDTTGFNFFDTITAKYIPIHIGGAFETPAWYTGGSGGTYYGWDQDENPTFKMELYGIDSTTNLLVHAQSVFNNNYWNMPSDIGSYTYIIMEPTTCNLADGYNCVSYTQSIYEPSDGYRYFKYYHNWGNGTGYQQGGIITTDSIKRKLYPKFYYKWYHNGYDGSTDVTIRGWLWVTFLRIDESDFPSGGWTYDTPSTGQFTPRSYID